MPINPMRGEAELHLAGVRYVMRPTFEALSRIEQQLDTGFFMLARKLADQHLLPDELAVIVTHCIEAASHHPCKVRGYIREALSGAEVEEVQRVVAQMFTQIIRGLDVRGGS